MTVWNANGRKETKAVEKRLQNSQVRKAEHPFPLGVAGISRRSQPCDSNLIPVGERNEKGVIDGGESHGVRANPSAILFRSL